MPSGGKPTPAGATTSPSLKPRTPSLVGSNHKHDAFNGTSSNNNGSTASIGVSIMNGHQHHHSHPSATTPSSVKSYHDQASSLPTNKLIHRTLRQMLKCASYAFVARLLFGILKTLGKKGISKRGMNGVIDELVSSNPWKWSVLVGSLASYRGVRVLLERFTGLPPVAATAAAGGIASLGTFVMNMETRTELSLYLFIRALHGLIVTFGFPNAPRWAQNFNHWDVVMVGLTAGQILYGAFFAPNSHNRNYQNFLMRCTMIEPRCIAAVGGLQTRVIVPDCVDYCWEKKIPLPSSPNDVQHSCVMIHPGQTCNQNYVRFILQHLRTFSLPLYVPLKVVTTLLFSWKKLLKQPKEVIKKMVIQSLSSSLFLTLYCGGPFRVLCFFNAHGIHSPQGIATFVGITAAPATFLENKQRRLDLALFCSMHALRSAYLMLVDMGYLLRPNRHYITAMTMSALGVLFYQVDFHPELAHQNVRSGVAWLLKEPHVVHHEHQIAGKTSREPSISSFGPSSSGGFVATSALMPPLAPLPPPVVAAATVTVTPPAVVTQPAEVVAPQVVSPPVSTPAAEAAAPAAEPEAAPEVSPAVVAPTEAVVVASNDTPAPAAENADAVAPQGETAQKEAEPTTAAAAAPAEGEVAEMPKVEEPVAAAAAAAPEAIPLVSPTSDEAEVASPAPKSGGKARRGRKAKQETF